MNYKIGYKVYLNYDVIILGYPLGNTVVCCPGKITEIKGRKFKHNCDTNVGSSGSPIILASNLNVIGIHKAGIINKAINLGFFIGDVMDDIKNNPIYNYNMNKKNTNIVPINTNDIYTNTNKNYIRTNNINKGNTNINIDLNSTNNINAKTNKDKNYIVAIFEINTNDINRDIRIINSYEAIERSNSNLTFEENQRNEEEIKQCKILIEGKFIPFSYIYKYHSAGLFKVIYFFKNDIKGLNYMFCCCSNLIRLDLSNFNTQNVINMNGMFSFCSKLGKLVLSNFKTQNVLFERLITLDDDKSTVLYGAGITDIYIKIAGYIILAFVMIISVFRAIRFFLKKDTKSVIKSLAIVPGYLVSLFVVLFGFQFIFVSNRIKSQK